MLIEVAAIPPEKPRQKPLPLKPVSLALPPSLVERLDRIVAAKNAGIERDDAKWSRSSLVVWVIEQYLRENPQEPQ